MCCHASLLELENCFVRAFADSARFIVLSGMAGTADALVASSSSFKSELSIRASEALLSVICCHATFFENCLVSALSDSARFIVLSGIADMVEGMGVGGR